MHIDKKKAIRSECVKYGKFCKSQHLFLMTNTCITTSCASKISINAWGSFSLQCSLSSVLLSLEGSIIPLVTAIPMGVPGLCIASHVAMGLRDINFS